LNSPSNCPEPTLDELFDRDPLQLSDKDIAVLTAHYRKEAREWLNNPKPKRRKAATPKKPMPKNLTLADLGLVQPS